jgi:hypothetical protein
VHSQDCEDDLYCQTLFIPSTTWTEGRNLLAEDAVYAEAKLGKKYKYWAFSDDDVYVVCNGDVKGLQCWNNLFNYVHTEMPPNAAVLALPLHNLPIQNELSDCSLVPSTNELFSSVSTFDACFNLIRREAVPILIPYVTMPKGSSEWHSQAALFAVTKHCLHSAAVFPGIRACNAAHREYIKGVNLKQIEAVLHDNYASFMQLDRMPSLKSFDQDRIGPFNTSEELKQHMRALNISKCEPLLRRFADWEQKALDLQRRKDHFYSVRIAVP